MCGIAGFVATGPGGEAPRPDIRAMIAMLRHRGPETAGIYDDGTAALGHARLSIIDLEGGVQPIPNEDGTVWAICNGEFYNYVELRSALIERGHHFRTQSDSEVLIHLYEDLGRRAAEELNGEFAFGLWDGREQTLWLGRDRFGVRPLFYAVHGGHLLFASEVKALFAAGVPRQIDPRALAQVFTCWAPLPGRSVFAGVHELPPGHVASVRAGAPDIRLQPYWRLVFAPAARWPSGQELIDTATAIRTTLTDAVKIRLRADVPVGAYLSGGLDSSLVTSLAQSCASQRLHTFSIAFRDHTFDEREHQERVAEALGTAHHVVECDAGTMWSALPDVVWHAEAPLLRLSPVPLFLLSQLVQQYGMKVVLTGEGSDELFGGYDIFKEAMVRRFWARVPDSQWRYRLLARIYPHISGLHDAPPAMLKAFFGQGLQETGSPCYSHLLRWRNTSRAARFLSRALAEELRDYDPVQDVEPLIPAEIERWDAVSQAQYLEIVTFLSTYLLSSQGDRMSMAHAVEGRYPFLDPHVAELALRLPRAGKIAALRSEKVALRRAAEGLIPDEVLARPKQAYRAPIRSTFAAGLPDYARELLSPERLAESGYFEPRAAGALVRKVQSSSLISEADQMAMVGILTTQLLHDRFIHGWAAGQASVRGMWAVDVRAALGNASAQAAGLRVQPPGP